MSNTLPLAGGSSLAPVLMLTGTPADAVVGKGYFFRPAPAGGAPGRTLTFVLSAGTLPEGLTFSSHTGTIRGSATTAGTTSGLAITVTDGFSTATLSGLSLVVASAPVAGGGVAATSIAIARSADGSVGQTYTFTVAPAGAPIQVTRTTLGANPVTTDIAGATALTYQAQQADFGYTIGARGVSGSVSAKALGPVLSAIVDIDKFETTTGRSTTVANSVHSLTAPLTAGAANSLTLTTVKGGNGVGISDKTISGLDLSTMDIVVGAINYDSLILQSYEMQIRKGAVAIGPIIANPGLTALHGMRYIASVVADAAPPAGVTDMTSRLRIGVSTTSRPSSVTAGRLVGNARGRATVVFTFDDGFASPYTKAAPVFDQYGAKATFYVPSTKVQEVTNGTGLLSKAQIADLVARGYHIGLDTSDDTPYTSWPPGAPTKAGAVDQWNSERAYFAALGVPDSHLRHICYPNGVFKRAPVRAIVTAATFNGTNTVTFGAAPTATAYAGMTVLGFDVPTGTVVASVAGDQLSAVITGASAVPAGTMSIEMLDRGEEFFSQSLPNALGAAGVYTARATGAIDPERHHSRFGFGANVRALSAKGFTNGTFATLKAWIDDAVKWGTTNICYIHDLPTPNGNRDNQGIGVFDDDMIAAINYAGGLVNQGVLDILSMKQVYERDGASSMPA